MWSKKELFALGHVDPDLERLLLEEPETPNVYNLEERRAMGAKALEVLRQKFSSALPGVQRTEISYPTADGSQRRALLYQPARPGSRAAPLVLQIHGGGFMIGEPEFEEGLCRNLVRAFDAVCLSIAYRHSPEQPFPAAHEDALDAFKFAASKAESWGADLSEGGFIVGGCSAGGNLAAALTLWAKQYGNTYPSITGQYLLNPWLTVGGDVPPPYNDIVCSYEQNSQAPVLPRKMLDVYLEAYQPGKEFEIFSYANGFSGIPSTFIQVSGLDPLRDEAVVYEDMLRASGCSTRMDIYAGLPHIFWFLYPSLEQQIRTLVRDQISGFSWLLRRAAKVVDLEI